MRFFTQKSLKLIYSTTPQKANVLPENTTRYGDTYTKSDLLSKAAKRMWLEKAKELELKKSTYPLEL